MLARQNENLWSQWLETWHSGSTRQSVEAYYYDDYYYYHYNKRDRTKTSDRNDLKLGTAVVLEAVEASIIMIIIIMIFMIIIIIISILTKSTNTEKNI